MKPPYPQLRIVLCVVAASSVAGAAGAVSTEADAAVSGVTIREEPRQVTADETLGINADCDADEGPLGGGVRWAPGSSLLNNRILSMEPKGTFRPGIRTEVRDYDVGGTDAAVAIAICAPDADLPTIRARNVEGEVAGGSLTASCDPGELAIGGGVFGGPRAFGRQATAESRPSGVGGDGVASSWTGRYIDDSGPDGRFRVQVLCAEPSDDFTVEAVTSPQIPYPPGALAAATAECPRPDQIAIGGGFGSNGPANVANGLVASQPGALVGGQPRSWTVIGAAATFPPLQQLEGYVMCATQAEAQPSVAFDSKSKLPLTPKGVAKLALACSADAGQRCQGALTLKGTKGEAKRILRAKPASFSIPAETTKRLKLKLRSKAHKLVKRSGRRGAKAKVTATLLGQTARVRRAVRLVARR